MIPLVSDLLPFPAADAEGRGFLASASTPNWLSPSSRMAIVDPIIQGCPELIAALSEKVAYRDKHATQTADAPPAK
jgi:hypothetical protein